MGHGVRLEGGGGGGQGEGGRWQVSVQPNQMFGTKAEEEGSGGQVGARQRARHTHCRGKGGKATPTVRVGYKAGR